MHTIANLLPREIIKNKPFVKDGAVIRESRSFVVVSNTLVQQNTESCVCVGITSSEETGPFLIPMRRRDIEGGINDDEEEQQIDCSKIITLFKNQVLEKTGLKISMALHSQVIEKIHGEIIPQW